METGKQEAESKPEDDQLAQVDSDEDGLTDEEEKEWGTDPDEADTDGDGFQDGYEVFELNFNQNWEHYPHKFNPLIADLPAIDIEIKSPPLLTMNFTTGENEQKSFSNGLTQETRSSVTTTSSMDVSLSVESSVNYSIDSFGGSYSTSVSETIGYSRAQSVENGRVYSRSREFASSHSIDKSGGTLSISIAVKNPGNIAYTLRSMTLDAFLVDPRNPEVMLPVGNLLYGKWGAIPEKTLRTQGRGKLGPLVFANENLNLEMFNRILLNQGNLVVKVSQYELADQEGALDLQFTGIGAKTAEINIDYAGKRPPESFLVSPYSEDAKGVSLASLFSKVLRLEHRTGAMLTSSEAASPARGLLALREFDSNPQDQSRWVVVHSRQVKGEQVTTRYDLNDSPYDLEKIIVQPGHVLNLIYLEDKDGDGLGARTEFVYGTDPNSKDSDGDGLTDDVEIKGWEIQRNGKTIKIQTNPVLADSDGDGVNDAKEKAAGTDAAQPPMDISLVRQFGTKATDRPTAVHVNDMGDVFVASRQSGRSKSYPLTLEKFNRFGDPQWTKSFAYSRGGAETSGISGFALGDNGNLYVSISEYVRGKAYLSGHSKKVETRNRLILRTMNSTGGKLLDTIVATPQTELPRDVVIDSEGYVYVSGTTSGNLAQGNRSRPKKEVTMAFIAKFHPDGKLFWAKQFQPSECRNLCIDRKRGRLYLAGNHYKREKNSNFSNVYVKCLDLNARLIWSSQIESKSQDYFADMAIDQQGSLLITGSTLGDMAGQKSAGKSDGFLAKLDLEGKTQWVSQFGTAGDDPGCSLVTDSGGRIFVLATTSADFRKPERFDASRQNQRDIVLLTFGTTGQQTDVFQVRTPHHENATGLAVDPMGNLYALGSTDGPLEMGQQKHVGGHDLFLIRFSPQERN